MRLLNCWFVILFRWFFAILVQIYLIERKRKLKSAFYYLWVRVLCLADPINSFQMDNTVT